MKHLIVDINCKSGDVKQKALKELQNVCNQCRACELYKTRTSVVFADGNPDAKIMLIGEAPGADEDMTGTPFVGRAGQLLNTFLKEAGFDREKDFYICNTIKCRPPQNRVPSNEEKRDIILRHGKMLLLNLKLYFFAELLQHSRLLIKSLKSHRFEVSG